MTVLRSALFAVRMWLWRTFGWSAVLPQRLPHRSDYNLVVWQDGNDRFRASVINVRTGDLYVGMGDTYHQALSSVRSKMGIVPLKAVRTTQWDNCSSRCCDN